MSEERMLFICGSGISLDGPSWLPKVEDIKSLAREHLLPAETEEDRFFSALAINDVQPEMFFEQVVALLGSEYLTIWNVLRRPANTAPPTTARWVPNLYHYIVVWIACQHGTPIVTFNMDTLFEEAATTLGLAKDVYVGGRKSTEYLLKRRAKPGRVSIWKIHGCVETTDERGESTLYTTMSQIARPNYRVIRALSKLAGECRFCIVGYSGRDVDFFPHLCRVVRNKMRQKPLWINPSFSESTPAQGIAKTTLHERCDLLEAEGRGQDLMQYLKPLLPQSFRELAHRLPAYDTLEAMVESRDTSCAKEEKERNSQELIRENEGHLSFRKLSLAEKRALLVSVLLYSGDTCQGYKYGQLHMQSLEKELAPAMTVKVLLDFARLCDWNSKYEQYKGVAARILKKGKEIECKNEDDLSRKLLAEIGGGCLLTRARHMLMGPVVDMDWPDPRFTYQIPPSTKASSFFMHLRTTLSARLGLLFRRLVTSVFNPGQRPSIHEVLAKQYYLDHQQVFINLVLRWLGPTGRLLGKPWLAILKRSVERAGSAYTQADVYLFRFRYGLEENATFAHHIWSLVGHPVGLALLHLGDGEKAYKAGRMELAESDFERAYDVASSCGNHLTALKALIAIFHVNKSHRLLNGATWTRHVADLQGDRHKEYFVPLGEYIYKSRLASPIQRHS